MSPTTKGLEPQEKRQRTVKKLRGKANPDAVFRRGLLTTESCEAMTSEYDASGPYKHVVIPKLVDESLLRKVRSELLAIHATRKETDIYRVFQTGDLANLDGLPAHELTQLSSLLELRNALYSEEFRTFIAKICGVGKLSPSKADLSHNIYKNGCHLLCHDDVIGTRSISYIIYLTDPEQTWREEDGGGLELFPVISKGTPAVHPSVVIPPMWNQMAMFAVQPGHSFHSVAEVVAVDRDRPSISGWFHVMQPEDMDDEEFHEHERNRLAQRAESAKPSMEQLFTDDGKFPFADLPKFSIKGPDFDHEEETETPIKEEQAGEDDEEEEEDDVPLTESEIAFLKPFINPSYLNPKVIQQANARFCEESSIQLASFLDPSLAAALSTSTQHQDVKDGLLLAKPRTAKQPAPIANYNAGVSNVWTATGPSHKHRFLSLNPATPAPSTPPKDRQDPTADLASLQHTLFQSKPFLRLLYLLTSLKPTRSRSRVRRFRPGMDYTLATTSGDSDDEQGVLDATLCFVCERTPAEARVWEGEEVGGFDCYMAPDEGNEDPAQYRAQKRDAYGTVIEEGEGAEGDGGALLSVSPRSNCLMLVMREATVMRFIKYVGARAPGSRWDVAFEFQYE
ncbi:Oxoglutarate and iron-dependent oxygenase degradation C-term-domain-containing protein [Chytriomyces sp. MP71]|nr:Oxoglutarate and iron-dependent oxygenase degradation C-term-domain-containing protein [Chytriomyces sp. MP71]